MTQRMIERGQAVIDHAVAALSAVRVDAEFAYAVQALKLVRQGPVIVSGMGKSGIIAQKIAATLTSTGTPSVFIHPTDAMHGDCGIVPEDGVAIIVSKSGTSNELVSLVDFLEKQNVCIIAITGDPTAWLAKRADVVLLVTTATEACALDLAPTTSTTMALAMGDALAVVLLEEKKFTRDQFAKLHPGGALGEKLSVR